MDQMKIVAGVSNLDEARWFLRKGADELYFALAGFRNHRRASLSFSLEKDSRALLRLCAGAGRPLYLAVNEIYPREEYAPLSAAAGRFLKAGGAGLIIRDPGLIRFLRDGGFSGNLVLSTLGHCFNSAAMEFYARLGVSRITLPQHLLPSEARGIVKNRRGLETEAFAMINGYCANVDGSCRYHDIESAEAPGYLNCQRSLPAPGGRFRLTQLPAAELVRNIAAFHALGVRYFKLGRFHDFERNKRGMLRLSAVREKLLAAGGRKAP